MNIKEWVENGKPRNVILHGDCMELMEHFSDKEICLSIPDPPYGNSDGVERTGGTWSKKYQRDKTSSPLPLDFTKLCKTRSTNFRHAFRIWLTCLCLSFRKI